MALDKITYSPGDILTSDQMNKIQDSIVTAEGNIEQHFTDANPHNITPAAIGAFSKSGGTISGNLGISTNAPYILFSNTSESATQVGYMQLSDNGRLIFINRDKSDSAKTTQLSLYPDTTSLNEVFRLYASGKSHIIFGTHNKPTGTYTGNGSATSRTIATGAIGNNVLIESTNGCAILTGNCWIGWTPTSAKYGMYSTAHGNNGTITLATSDALLNANGVEYRYQYL